MKSRFFWKIFLWFWLAMLVIALTTAFFSNYVIRQHYMPLKNNALISAYTVATKEIYMYAGPRGVVDLFQRFYQESGAELYLINERGKSVLTYEFPDTPNFILSLLQRNTPPEAFYKKGPWMLGPQISTFDGHEYRILAKLPPARGILDKNNLLMWWTRFTIAFIIISVICYLLSLYITRPIRKLKTAAMEIGKGNLEVRVANQLSSKVDEIADLATEFDRMAAQLQNLLDVQTKMLHDVSHELRSPLTRLQVALELAQRQQGQNLEKAFDRIGLECERLDELVGEILSWSRLQVLRKPPKKPIELVKFLTQIIKDANYEFMSLATKAELVCELDSLITLANERLLRRAIENVLRNALRFTEVGTPVQVHLRLVTKEQWVYIDIDDGGPGVPEQELKNIFMPFYRLQGRQKNQQANYGLGLAIAEQAMKIHQGHISAKNREPQGLSVCLRFPQLTEDSPNLSVDKHK